ncbi:MAG: hypothetical protein VCD00_02455 [Candidatus Hydrogenedentota bacterium]
MTRILGILGAGLLVLGILFFAYTRNQPTTQTDGEEDLFARGEYLCREARWDEARRVLREFLLDNPEHPGAHFYLGRSYLLWKDDFRPAIAEGELQTALALYHENGGTHHIERFSDEYFELICNIESAKVCMEQFTKLLDAQIPARHLSPIVLRARRYIEAARDINPTYPEIAPFTELVNMMTAIVAENSESTIP